MFTFFQQKEELEDSFVWNNNFGGGPLTSFWCLLHKTLTWTFLKPLRLETMFQWWGWLRKNCYKNGWYKEYHKSSVSIYMYILLGCRRYMQYLMILDTQYTSLTWKTTITVKGTIQMVQQIIIFSLTWVLEFSKGWEGGNLSSKNVTILWKFIKL